MEAVRGVLGTASYGTEISKEDSWKLMDTYAALGGRIIDTANNYASWVPNGKGGDSELVIGEWLDQNDRSAFTVMTKIGSMQIPSAGEAPHAEGLSAPTVYRAVEDCLTRLGCDSLDVLLAHHDDLDTPLREMWEAFTALKASGKVKKIGVSNYVPERMSALADVIREHDLAPVEMVELKYSAIDPVTLEGLGKVVLLDGKMKETLKQVMPDAGIVGYAILLSGLFEKDTAGEWPKSYDSPENRQRVKDIQSRAAERGVTPSAYALKMVQDEGYYPIIATSKVDRLISNMALLRTDR